MSLPPQRSGSVLAQARITGGTLAALSPRGVAVLQEVRL
jgi:hypothetical protein